MPRLPPILARNAPSLLLFVATLAVGLELARPFRSASIAYDSQASVLFFERIVAGAHLEEFVPTTSKPVLTVVLGGLYAVFHDWRVLAWLTLAVNALAVTLAAALARRVGGPAAGVFVGVGLLNNAGLLFDVGYALATPYALAGWAVAGLALTGPRPRFAVAGFSLAWATLARIETLVVVGVIVVALAVDWLWAARRGRPHAPTRAWLVPIVAALAVPILMLHDLLLAGDPLLWTRVATIYTERTAQHVPSAIQIAVALIGRYWDMGALSLLAAIGVVRLLAARRPWPAIALVAQVLGITAFLVSLAARHIYVTLRYTTAIDVGVVFAAGIGLAAISVVALDWPPLTRAVSWLQGRVPRVARGLAIAAVALLLAGPYVKQSPELRTVVRASLDTATAADEALAAIEVGLRTPCPSPSTTPQLIAHGSIRPRLVVDLGLRLPNVIGSSSAVVKAAIAAPEPCAVILHVRASDGSGPEWAAVEISQPGLAGGSRLEPLLADPAAGVWVINVR